MCPMEHERWKAIPGWEGHYEVSDHGRVRSLPRKHRRTMRFLKPMPQRKGHLMVNLSENRNSADGRLEQWFIHRLVLTAFVGPRPAGMITRHLDGDPANNRLQNLAWGSYKDNHEDAKAHGTFEYGEMRSQAKITDAQCVEMRHRAAAGEDALALAEAYGIAYRTAHHIITGVKWRRLGGPIQERRERWYLNEDQVREIRSRRAAGDSLAKLGKAFGVPPNSIKMIAEGKSYKWVT